MAVAPNVEDNLNAAAAPISVDPRVKKPNPDPRIKPLTPRQRRINQLVEAGVPFPEASKIAEEEYRNDPMAEPDDSPRIPYDMTQPGPETLDGKPPALRRPIWDHQEQAAYEVRKPGEYSQKDRDMMARGYVPVVMPDGVHYLHSASSGGALGTGDVRFDGGPDRPGDLRPDLTEKGYKPKEFRSPTGQSVWAYVPGEDLAAKQAAAKQERIAANQQRKKEFQDQQAESRKLWRATTMLAGGANNINGGNRAMYNQLAMLSPEDRERALLYMTPSGARLAAVDAQNMANAGEVIKRFMTSGAAAGANNPATQAAIQQQQLQQQQDMVKWAEDNINTNYAWDSDTWIPGSAFTESERQQAINDLMDRYGPPAGTLTLAEATRIVDNIAERKPRPRAARPGADADSPAHGWSSGPGGLPVPSGTPDYQWR